MRPMEFYAEFVVFLMTVPVAALLGYGLGYLIRSEEGKIVGGLITGALVALMVGFLYWNPNNEPQASFALMLMLVITGLLFAVSAIVLMVIQNMRRRLVVTALQRQAIPSGRVINQIMNPNNDHRRP